MAEAQGVSLFFAYAVIKGEVRIFHTNCGRFLFLLHKRCGTQSQFFLRTFAQPAAEPAKSCPSTVQRGT